MLLFLKHILIGIYTLFVLPHPFYLSVTECKYNTKNKSIEVSCKMFTNDLEDALKKKSGKTVDLINPKNKEETGKILFEYIEKRLKITVNQKLQKLNYIGFEKEDDVIWTYMEIKNVEKPKTVKIENTLLFDFLKEQINIVHLEVGSYKESSKVTNPDYKLEFTVR